MKWTQSQEQAINHHRDNPERGAIISAGAGSGKTAVLTEMVISRIKDGSLDPSRCAIVTFTEKAAGELKVRLNSAMKKCIEESEGNPEMQKLLKARRRKLRGARISTISSFCFGIIRDNIELSPLSQGFTVIDDQRAQFMKLSSVNEAIDEFCTSRPDDIKFLLEQTEGKTYNNIIRYALDLREFLCSICNREEWIENSRNMAYDNVVKKRRRELTLEECKRAIANFDIFKNFPCDSEKIKEFITSHENSTLAAVKDILENKGTYTENAVALMGKAPSRAVTIKNNDELKAARDNYKKAYEAAVASAKLYSAKDDEKQKAKTKRLINLLIDLTLCYEQKYTALKLLQNNADFSDAESMVYGMIKSHPEIKQKMDFQLIVVDEFQDSNKMQYEIFKGLSNDCKNLYFVGDIKQSIYSFRKAQPEVFSAVCADSENYREIKLSENFRSRENVIDGVNYIFDRIMTSELGDVDYINEGRLIAGRTDKASPCDITEVLITSCNDSSGKSSEIQARAIASEIRSMIDRGYLVCDGEVKRPCRQEDFAIIMRSPNLLSEIYISALKAYGLTAEINGGTLTDQPEIAVMLDYLKAIDNPYNDDSLARLMMSVLYGFTARQMSEIKSGLCDIDIGKSEADGKAIEEYCRGFKKMPLYSCVLAAADNYRDIMEKSGCSFALNPCGNTREKCRRLKSDLRKFSAAKASLSPAKLIRLIYDTTPAKQLLVISDDARRRSENLSSLSLCAASYSDINGGTLGDFLRNLKIMEEQGRVPEAAASAGGGVTVLSIHRSKGLQYPIVFVAECDHMFNTDDSKRRIIFSEKYGIACKTIDRRKFSIKPDKCLTMAIKEIREKLRSEEMRLLYVAATRAQDKLFFTVANEKGLDDFLEKSAKTTDTSGSSYEMWLRAVAGNAMEKAVKSDKEDTDVAPAEDEKSGNGIKLGELLYREISASENCGSNKGENENTVIDKSKVNAILDMINFSYPYTADTKIAAKYSATEIVRNRKAVEGNDYGIYISRPPFLQDKGELSGKRRGDAYHKLMEHIPMQGIMSAEQIGDYLKSEATAYLTAEEADCINPADIEKFMKSKLSRRISAAAQNGMLYREHPVFHKMSTAGLTPEMLGIEDGTALSDSETCIQGIADMFFIEDGHIVLVDYKSDSFKSKEEPAEHYGIQLKIYREALQAEFGMPVTEMYIYAFKYGEFIPIK